MEWCVSVSILEIVRLDLPRLGTWRKQKEGLYAKVVWPPMALRIGLLRSSALQNDGRIVPVILQCRTPHETNPKGHWGPNYFFIKSSFFFSMYPVLVYPVLRLLEIYWEAMESYWEGVGTPLGEHVGSDMAALFGNHVKRASQRLRKSLPIGLVMA